jgi:hypothetical protein
MTGPTDDRLHADSAAPETASESREWEAPTLTVLGDVGALTGAGASSKADASTNALVSGI